MSSSTGWGSSYSHLCASVNKLYNLVLATGRWFCVAEKVIASLVESNHNLGGLVVRTLDSQVVVVGLTPGHDTAW